MVASVLMMRLPKVQGKFASGLLSLHQVMREHGLCLYINQSKYSVSHWKAHNWQGLSFLLCWSITGLFKKKKTQEPTLHQTCQYPLGHNIGNVGIKHLMYSYHA